MARESVEQKRLSMGTFFRGAIGALLGAGLGILTAPRVLALFDEAPSWVSPVVIIGAVAICLAAFLLVPLYLRGRKP